MLSGAASQSKYQLCTKFLSFLELRAEQFGCQANRPLSKALPGFEYLKPSQQLNFPWTGWSSSCPSAVLQAHFHIVQTKLTSNSSLEAALHISTVLCVCETPPNPTPGKVLLPLPTKVHELCFIHSSLLAFPVEIGPSGPLFVSICLCASHLLLSRHTLCRFNKPWESKDWPSPQLEGVVRES